MGSFGSGLLSGGMAEYNAQKGFPSVAGQPQQPNVSGKGVQPSPQQQPIPNNPYLGIIQGLYKLFTHPSMQQNVRPTFPGNPTLPQSQTNVLQPPSSIGQSVAPPQQNQSHTAILAHLLNILGLGQGQK